MKKNYQKFLIPYFIFQKKKKSKLLRQILSILFVIIFQQSSYSQWTITTTSTSPSNVSGRLAQSFTATGTGILDKIKVVSAIAATGKTLTIRNGDDANSPVLGTTDNNTLTIASNMTDYSIMDVSSLNISVTNGNVYTFSFEDNVDLYFDDTSTNIYPGGQFYFEKMAISSVDLLFEIDIALPPATTPTVSTTSASNIATTSATLGGNVTSNGGAPITERGIVYSTSDTTPTIAETATKSTNASGETGVFSNSVSSLTAGTTYYCNSYAINSEGTSYGTATSFTTLDPTVAFASTASSGLEDVSTKILTVNLSAASAKTITVAYAVTGTATGSATDYTLANGTLTYTPSQTSKTITIASIINDVLDESDETVIVTLSSPTNSTLGTNTAHTYTITDNDAAPTVTLSLSGSPLAENAGVATVTASLNTASAKNVTVTIATSGTATGSGTDYTLSSTTITINAGATSGTATITGADDALDEASETVIIDITGVSNGTESGTQQVTALITDDDAAPTVTLSLSGSPLNENAGVATITAALNTASSQTVTVTIGVSGTATGSGTDYTLSSTTITINAGATSGTATITGADDALDEATETVIIDITGVSNATESGTQQVTASIINDDAAPSVTTTAATSITTSSATLAGNITSSGSATISEKGIVYAITSINADPLIGESGVTKDDNGIESGIFSESVTGLIANTQYSSKAYAINSAGTSYGSVQTFTTTSSLSVNTSLNESLRLYPNPISNILHISKPSHINITSIFLYNNLGRILKRSNYTSTLDCSNLQSGLYYIKIDTNTGSVTKKIVKK